MFIIPLPNIGLSCFANSSLQCIWNCKLIQEFIETHTHMSVTCKCISDTMNNRNNKIRKLIEHIQIPLNTEFDAGEFLMILFDKIITETKCKYKQSKSLLNIPDNIKDQAIQNHKIHWSDNDYSKIVDIIFGQQYTLYQHNECEYNSVNISYFNQLVLHSHSKYCNITDMLKQLLKDEILDTSCSICTNMKSSQYISIWPQILVFNINSRNAIKKLNKNLIVDNIPYTLNSVICYQGSNNSGHYYAIIHSNGKWIECNDTHINNTSCPTDTCIKDYYITIYTTTQNNIK
jgi:ubiquitin C-terminal hydrolase